MKQCIPFLLLSSIPFTLLEASTVCRFSQNEDQPTIAAICSVTTSDVSCWSTDKVSEPELAARVKAHLVNSNSSQMLFRFGKKNRLLLVETPPNISFADESRYRLFLNKPMINGSDRMEGISGAYNLWWISSEEADRSVDVTLRFSKPIGDALELPLKVGAAGRIGSYKFTIIGIEQQKTDIGSPRRWYIKYSVNPGPDVNRPWSIRVKAIGMDGEPGQAVDSNLKMVLPAPGVYPPEDAIPIVQPFRTNVFVSRADPSTISKLQISADFIQSNEIKNVPLDSS